MSAQSKSNVFTIFNLLTSKPENDYENIVSWYLNMFLLENEQDNTKSKQNFCKKFYFNLLVNSLSPETFQFFTSTQYFPRNIVDIAANSDKVRKGISLMIEEMVKKSNYNKNNISSMPFEGFHEFILENFFIGKFNLFQDDNFIDDLFNSRIKGKLSSNRKNKIIEYNNGNNSNIVNSNSIMNSDKKNGLKSDKFENVKDFKEQESNINNDSLKTNAKANNCITDSITINNSNNGDKKIYSNRLKSLSSNINNIQPNSESNTDKKKILSSNFKGDFVYDTKFTDNSLAQSNSLQNIKYNKQTKILDIINKLKGKLEKVSLRNDELLNKIDVNNKNISTIKTLSKDCFLKSYDKNDLLKDIYFEHKIFHYWRSLLKKKNEKENIKNYTSFQDEKISTNSDDIVCVVCNDGDYEENDLIVYCAVRFF